MLIENNDVNVKQINLFDLDELLRLDQNNVPDLRKGFYHHSDIQLIQKCLSSGWSIGAFIKGRLVGYRLSTQLAGSKCDVELELLKMGVMDMEQKAVLYGTLIDKEFRGSGIGSLLLKESKQWLSSNGVKELWVTVHPDNVPSVNMLKSAGFKTVKQGVFYDSLVRNLMSCLLENMAENKFSVNGKE